MFSQIKQESIVKKIVLSFAFLILPALAAHAAEVRIVWEHPDRYTDIRAGEENQAAFEQRVFKSFGEIFNRLARTMPDGDVWEIKVTDLDLAGEVKPRNNGQWIRVIRDVDWPRMSFSYVLKDAQGQEIAQGQEDLSDMSFSSRIRSVNPDTSFWYEEMMIKDWFRAKQEQQVLPKK
jgi:hypothetical protein